MGASADTGRGDMVSRRAAITVTVLALGLLVLVLVARTSDASTPRRRRWSAGGGAGLLGGEYKRRWRLERRNALARARTVRRLRRTMHVRARRAARIDGVWVALANCESGGRWHYNGSSGFDGGLQFHPSTWAAYAPGLPGVRVAGQPGAAGHGGPPGVGGAGLAGVAGLLEGAGAHLMAQGSHATWTPGQPRVCHRCGKRLNITRDTLWLQGHPEQLSWHFTCRVEAR